MKNDDDKPRKRNSDVRWIIQIFFISILLSGAMTFLADMAMSSTGLFLSAIVILLLIIGNFISDLIGMAVMSTDQAPFMAMASKKVRGAKHSLYIVQHAEKVSNICCDVIGDICGIVSGAAGAAVVILVVDFGLLSATLWSILISALISALTISLKGIGKIMAARNGKEIIRIFGYVISFIPIKSK